MVTGERFTTEYTEGAIEFTEETWLVIYNNKSVALRVPLCPPCTPWFIPSCFL